MRKVQLYLAPSQALALISERVGQLRKLSNKKFLLLPLLAALLFPSLAFAWPADSSWKPILRGGTQLQDQIGDSNNERNVVSEAGKAAAYYYNDGTDLFFRIRLDDSPEGSGGQGYLEPFGWGMEFDTDGVVDTYEYLIMLDGIATEEISIRRNTVQGNIDDPSDNAEVQLYADPLSPSNYRIVAADTFVHSTQDYFIDWKVDFAAYLAATGLSPDQPIRTYWGTSNNTSSLAADLCDITGSDTLSASFSDVVTFWGTTATTAVVSFADDILGNGNPAIADISDNLFVKVVDGDRNFTPDAAQVLSAAIAGGGDSETVTLTETGLDTGIFTGQLPTAYSAVATGSDGILQALGGTVFTVTFIDTIDSAFPVNRDQPRTASITMRAASVTAAKVVSSPSAVGKDNLVYTVTITSAGPGNARVSEVIDTLPAGFTYSAGTTSGLTTSDPAVAGQVLTWTGPWIVNSGSSATLSFTAQAGGPRATAYNNVTMNGRNFPSVSTGDTAPVQVVAPIVSIVKSADPAAAAPGQEITYTIHYKNTGDSSAHTLLLLDSAPLNTTYVAGSLRAGDASSTYATATPRTDGAGEGSWPEVQGEAVGGNITFNIISLEADDGVADSGPDEGKAYFKVLIQ
ncbi:DUF11 domain-containing protein [bacterium]|nr:MAG: DUF11 domain-containing protein [bacterium]